MYNLRQPTKGVESFAPWIWKKPSRCPGIRFQYELYHEIARNTHDIAKDGDIRDLTHAAAVPYVDAITMDRRMSHYSLSVAKRLFDRDAATAYTGRIFPDASALLRQLT